MPVIGALVHLPADTVGREQTLQALAGLAGVVLGQVVAGRVPVVLDTPDRDADRALWDALGAVPGVQHVDLVYADFSDLHPPLPDADVGPGGSP